MRARNLIWLAGLVLAGWGTFGRASTKGDLGVTQAVTLSAPAITSIQVKGTNLVVTAEAPAGVRKLTLEGRTRLGSGAWTPQAVQRLDGNGGTVTFKVVMSEQLEILRVRADEQDVLPASFFTGTNAFAGQPGGNATLLNGGVVNFESRDNNNPTTDAATTSRSVVESDIWKLADDTLYFFNAYRGLQVIDVHNPAAPVLRGTFNLPAAGEQMYLLPGGRVVLLARDGCNWWGTDAQSQIIILDTANPAGNPVELARVPVKGTIQESRMVGTALYVASQTYRQIPVPPTPGKPENTTSTQWEWGTIVTSFDLADPAKPVAKSEIWTSGYGAIVTATDRFFFIANSNPNNYWQSIARVIDITAPDGTMKFVSSITTAGRLKDKFKMNLDGDVFTAISEYWDQDRMFTNRTTRGGTVTKVQTFSLADPAAPRKLDMIEMGGGESLFASRFDGDRVYIVTFFRTDPLWVVDLSNPEKLAIHGELEVPGWSSYIQPMGDRLVAVGTETNRVTVSLFDVADLKKPGLLSRVRLGETYSWSEANYDEKAFGFIPEAGLLLLPYSGYTTNGFAQRVQLIDLGRDTLTARGFIEHAFQPRRAAVHRDAILSISGQDLLSVDATDRDHPAVRAQLELSWSADRVFVQGDYLVTLASLWNNASQVVLRVAAVADPDRVLGTLTVTNGLDLLGSTARDGRLYLLQGTSTQIIWPAQTVSLNDTNQPLPTTNSATLKLTVFDLANLPQLKVLGESNPTFPDTTYWGALEPLWPRPGLLVWSGSQYYWGGIFATDVAFASPGILGRGVSIFRPWGGGSTGQLVAFEVDNATPRFASHINLAGTNYWWNASKAFTANGLVYTGHQASEFVPGVLAEGQKAPEPVITRDADGTLTTNQPPIGTWVQRYYLDVVDYADASTPTLRKPVNIPGTLAGVSPEGALLYTTGYHWDPVKFTTDGAEWLDVCAYDGVEARLVDSLALPKNWPHPVFVTGAHTYIGRSESVTTGQVTTTLNYLDVWTLSGAGKLTAVPNKLEFDSPIQTFAGFGNLLGVQTGANIQLLDATNPAAPKLIGGGGPEGCIYNFNLGTAEGSLERGLWLPLGPYGVARITPKP